MMQLRPRSAQIHSKKNLPPVTQPHLRPGSSQVSLNRRNNNNVNHRSLNSSLTRKSRKQFNFRKGLGTVPSRSAPLRGLEANLSGAFNLSSVSNNITRNNTLAQSAAQMQAAHLTNSASSSTTIAAANTTKPSQGSSSNIGATNTAVATDLAEMFESLGKNITPSTDSGNTTQRSSDSEEDRTNENTNSVNSITTDTTTSMFPATAALGSIPSPSNGATATVNSNISTTNKKTTSSMHGTLMEQSIDTNNTNSANNVKQIGKSTTVPSSIRQNLSARPMTTQNPESRKRRNRQHDLHTNQQHASFNKQQFAKSNMQANHRRPGTAPEKLHRSQNVMLMGDMNGGSNIANMTDDEVRLENVKLRQQMEKMRMESFNKIRSGKRFSSGGGFRVSNRPPTADHSNKNKNKYLSEIQHLKNTIRTLTNDKQAVESELADSNIRLNRCIQNQKNLFNQVKTIELERDRLKETINVRERLISDQSNRLDEQEKALELALGRQRSQQEEILRLQNELRKMAENNEHLLSASPTRSKTNDINEIEKLKNELLICQNKLKENDVLIKTLNTTITKHLSTLKAKTDELSLLNVKLVETKQKNKELEAASKDRESELNNMKKRNNTHLNTIAKLKKEKDELKKDNIEKDKEIAKLKLLCKDQSKNNLLHNEIAELKQKLKEMIEYYKKKLLESDQNIALMESKNGQLTMKIKTLDLENKASKERAEQEEGRNSILSDEIKKLKLKIEELNSMLSKKDIELNRLRNVSKDGKSMKGELETQVKELKLLLIKKDDEIKLVRNAIDDQMERTRKAEQTTRTTQKALDMNKKELIRTEEQLNDEQNITEKLRLQIAECMKKLGNSNQIMKDACNKAKREALENSLQSMVRLCVVAPTVNVHFNSQQQQCKAPMPSSRIQNIIENQVLPNFSELFIQLEEGTAQNGEKLDKWLEGMLSEMQKSIQSHLADVFNDSKNDSQNSNNSCRPQTSQNSRRASMGKGKSRRPSTRGGY
jgi:hypothetical protein